MDKVIIVGVGVAVAVGTALYYLLTQEKPMQNRSRPSNRHSSPRPRPRSPPVTYSDVKPKPCRKREPVPGKVATKENISEISCHSEPDRESGEKLEVSRSSISVPPVLQENQDDAQSSQELTDYNDPNFTVCEVCEENANATFNPCKHKIFCYEHADYYIRLAKKYKRVPRCPNNGCREILNNFF